MSDPSTPPASTSQSQFLKSAALLVAAAVVAGGVAYAVASGQNSGAAALKDAIASQQKTIDSLNASLARLRADNSASLDKFRAESNAGLAALRAENSAGLDKLRAENADLRSRLAAADSRVATAEAAIAKSQQRNPNAVYQMGAEVGRVTGASEDRAASTVTFESIEGGNFDRASEFDYRDLTLVVKSYQGATTSFTGRGVQTQLRGVQASIVRTRAAP